MTIRLKRKSSRYLLSLWTLLLLTLVGGTTACTEVDCPLDNVVEMGIGLYEAETQQALTLADTLTVRPAGKDTILLNRAQNISVCYLPLRQGFERATLLLRFSNAAGQAATDTLFVGHTNAPHVESIDCPASVFHKITSVAHTQHPLSQMPLTIDSVAIANPTVNYDNIQHLKIYLRSTAR